MRRLGLILTLALTCLPQAALATVREIPVPDAQFQPIRAPRDLSINEAVQIAVRNFPSIAHRRYKLRAAIANVTLAKTQYLPNLNWDLQESGITGNRVASTVMNNVSGFDTVPVDSGPPSKKMSMKPIVNNLQGLNFNWLLVDGGLRHANDLFAQADARAARADLKLTTLDVAFDAASAFLDTVVAKQAIRAARASLDRMRAADITARTLVSRGLRPGADAASWDLDVVRAEIKVIKADKDIKLSLADLAEKLGIASQDIDVLSDPLVRSPLEIKNFGSLDLRSHPLALLKDAEIERWKAKVKVLDVAYRPHLWLNTSVWGKGSGEPRDINPIPAVWGGVMPQVFNYMAGLSFSFPVMEYFPLKAEKKIAWSNQMAAKANFDLALQVLEKKDVRARIFLDETRKIAEKTPLLVDAAKVQEVKTLRRYRAGLVNMVEVSEAERALADAEVENAIAQVEVWRSILALAYVQGELRPFLQLVEIAAGSKSTDNSPGSPYRR